MKKILTTSFFLLALTCSAFAAPTSIHAQTAATVPTASSAPASGTAAPAAAAPASNAAASQGAPLPTVGDPQITKGYNSVMIFIMGIFAWMVGVAALVLDYTAYYTVVTMGHYVQGLSAVGLVWKELRDMANIALIFGFIAIGISVILNTERLGYGKKMLPMLLVAAIFINFSLFFTEAIIDVGNLFATEFYTQINGGTAPTPATLPNIISGKEGISAKIMNQLGLTSVYGSLTNAPGATPIQSIFKDQNPAYIAFLAVILFMVTAFVMFALSFILLARFVVLILLIIIAPLGFAGLAVPKLASSAQKWWSTLFNQTLTAPVLLLVLYIALKVITDTSFLTGFDSSGGSSGGLAAFAQSGGSGLPAFAGVLMSFIVAIGLLAAVIMVAKNMSAFGTKFATKAAGALSFGAVSLGARATLGTAGNVLASKRMQSWARKGGAGGLALKAAVLTGKGLRRSTYDIRNAPGVGKTLNTLGAGEGAKLTAKQVHDAQYGVKPVKTWLQHSKEEREAAGREIDFKDAQKDFAAGTITQDQYDQKVAPVLAKMSTKQLEELGGIKSGVDALVKNLSPQQFEALLKSDKLGDPERDKLKEARYRPITDAIATGIPSNVSGAIKSLSKGELENMPSAIINDPLVLGALSEKQRETVIGSKDRTAAERDSVRKSSPAGQVEETFNTSGPIAAAAMLGSLGPQEIAKLPKNIIKDPVIIDKFTPAVLVALQEEKKLSIADISAITAHINTGAGPNSLRNYITGVGSAYWM